MNINDFNKFLNLASESLTCGPECQREKTGEELRQNVLRARTNVITAPYQVETSIKKYITYTRGEAAYDEFNEVQLTRKAQEISTELNELFNQFSGEIRGNISQFSGLLINYNNIIELYNTYVKKNKELEETIKSKNSDVLTNNRKTYYEDQQIDTLNSYYQLFFIAYAIIWVLFVVFIFVFPSPSSKITLIGIAFLLLIYPLIGTQIFVFFFNLFHLIISIFPKNVYKDL